MPMAANGLLRAATLSDMTVLDIAIYFLFAVHGLRTMDAARISETQDSVPILGFTAEYIRSVKKLTNT